MLPISGLFAGVILGYVARSNFFCTLSSLESHWYGNNSNGVRTWALAIIIAILTSQTLIIAGVIDVGASFYITSSFSWLGTIIGGVAFGVGMAFVGTCGFGALVRLGGGSLKSLMAIIILGLVALSTQRGILAFFRQPIESAGSIELSAYATRSLPDILTVHLSPLVTYGLIGSALILGLFWILKDQAFRSEINKVISGVLIGLVITFGWIVTSTISEASFDPVQIESSSFIAPVSDFFMQISVITDATPDYGVGMVIGVVIGAALAAYKGNNIQWEVCDNARELSRHIIGAALMGFGGVLSLGCTIGQGISAFSLLSISAPLAMISILIGARFGLAYLLEGDILAPIRY